MAKTREYAFRLTSVIALVASLMGAYVSFSKFLDWGVVKNLLGRAESLLFEAGLFAVFLLGVFRVVSFSLFHKDSSRERREAKSKH